MTNSSNFFIQGAKTGVQVSRMANSIKRYFCATN